MKKNWKKALSLVLAGLMTLSFGSCKEKAPEGYVKESAGNMFWEKEDVVTGNGIVTPDMSIRIYNYAPSIFQEDENTRYAYYCSNRYTIGKMEGENFMDEKGNNQVTDYIAFRKGVKVDGEWYWSEKSYVISPITLNGKSNHEYEGTQTCDPNVIKGEFKYRNKIYPYLMAYLACSTRDNQFNHICLAVAEKPEGPWRRCSDINPLVKYTTDGVPEDMLGTYLWGYGQASMISVDKKGRVLMFYSAIKPFQSSSGTWWHGTLTTVARYDFSDLNNVKREFFCEQMPTTGILRLSKDARTEKVTQVETVTNGDYAYDPTNNMIYGITDGSFNAKFAYGAAPVFRLENKSKAPTAEVGDVFKYFPKTQFTANGLSWETVGQVKSNSNQYSPTVHNTCIIRDEYGWVLDSKNIEVAVTGAQVNSLVGTIYKGETNPLWSYRIMRSCIAV